MKMKNERKIALFISLLIFITGIILSHTYRKYVYVNKIYDFHLADTIGSWVCVPSASLFFYGIRHKYSFRRCIISSTIAYILYEIMGLTGIHGTFDLFDIVAIIFSGLITFIIFLIIKKNHSQ
jgi:hypothetical protein